ncbi:hypothetical protein KASIA_p046 [Shewanella phage vB_SspS_KASIA]|nr:hypothetical protein KASIA_p046 [Shewanella phage vB_SspS_KASIA]
MDFMDFGMAVACASIFDSSPMYQSPTNKQQKEVKMSKVKFNPNDPKQVGSLGLHIMGINDMPAEKWLSYFTSDEMKNYAISDEQGFIGRLPPHLHDKATELLTQGYYINVPPEGDSNTFQSGIANHTAMKPTKATVSSVVREIVVTDKGVFNSVESLKVKLSGIYSIQDFGKIWVEALTLSGLDADIEYVSNTGKKKLLSAMKAAIVSVVENTVDNI